MTYKYRQELYSSIRFTWQTSYCIAVLAMILLFVAQVNAAPEPIIYDYSSQEYSNDDFSWIIASDGTAVITYCNNEDATSIEIPEKLNGYNVSRIGYLEEYEEGSYEFCQPIPTEVQTISVESDSQYFTAQNGVLYSKDKTVIYRYPAGNSTTSFSIPAGVKLIFHKSFNNSSKLTSVTIPSDVTEIGLQAFEDCKKLTSIALPDSLVTIGEEAFEDCERLQTISIPKNVTNIGTGAFEGCEGLSTITVVSGNTRYKSVDGVLFNKNKTTLIQYPPGKSGEYQIPDSVTSIGEGAFDECVKLTGVIIPASVINIGCWAFAWNENLSAVYFAGAPPFTDGDDLFEGVYGTAYYISGKAGWGVEFGGLPTVPWTSQVAFEGNGGTPSYASRIYNVGNPYGQLPTANRPGHVLTGWWTEANGGSLVNADTTVPLLTQEHTLYARWEQGQVLNTVTFELGGIGWCTGGGELLQAVEPGAAVVEPQVTEVEGWTFEGWDRDFQNITGDTTIRAVYSYEQSLRTGWNLISAKLNLVDESREPLLNNGAMTLDAKSKAYVSNWELAASQAVWIYCQNQTRSTIRLYGTADENFAFEASLKPGWNFVGPLYDHNLSNPDAIAWGWNGHSFYPTEILLAGHGYYLYWPGGHVAPAEDTYLIIDLSAGPAASSYPVSYRSTPPAYGWTDEYKTTKLVLRKIPAGTFTMGSPTNELGRHSDETQHQVTLTKDFYVGVFEVTQKQWERVMGSWPSYFTNVSYRDSRPVEKVKYDDIRGSSAGAGWPGNNAVDADSFLGRLRAKTGLTFDLPTEAQWEYACRAGTTTALNSGKNLTSTGSCPNMSEVGRYWYNGGSGYSSGGDTSGGTAKVGSYLPNQWGLYDMHGNVWEWCLDGYQSELGSSAQTDPWGAAGGSDRVLRGGCWSGYAYYCRSANRAWGSPLGGYYVLGFRLVRAVP